MIVLVFALRSEIGGLFGLDRDGLPQSVRPLFSGMGRARVDNCLRTLKENGSRPGLMLSAGFSGALTEGWVPGQVGVVEEFALRSEEIKGEMISSDIDEGEMESLLARFRGEGLSAQRCRALTSDRLIGSPRQKNRLGRETEAELVDMESYWVARFARKENIPVFGLRVAFDTIEQRLPPSDLFDPEGGGSPLELARWSLGSWSRFKSLLKAGKNLLPARRALVRSISLWLEMTDSISARWD